MHMRVEVRFEFLQQDIGSPVSGESEVMLFEVVVSGIMAGIVRA
jgi:hypothetical protein